MISLSKKKKLIKENSSNYLNKFVLSLFESTERSEEVSSEPVRMHKEIELPSDLLELSKIFFEHGKKFYLVGGAVRDALLGKTPKDLDIATDAQPREVIEILKEYPNEYKVVELGVEFGVIQIITKAGGEYEVATFRKDIGAGRRPDSVEFTTIENDVKRRDLTINALFYDIQNKEVVDYVGGIKDLENGIVKTVGDPDERFGEDRLRVLRAVRFAGRMGSELDKETYESIKNNPSLSGISGERIRDEFLKCLKSAKDLNFLFAMLSDLDMWSQIFPGMEVIVEGNNFPSKLSDTSTNVIVALLLKHNLKDVKGSKEFEKKLNKLRYTSKEVLEISGLLSLRVGLSDLSNLLFLKKQYDLSGLRKEDLEKFRAFGGGGSFDDSGLIAAFVRFVPSVTADEVLKDNPDMRKGPELGKEILRREIEKFKEMRMLSELFSGRKYKF